jgi:DNA polymerase III subunit gamma/tau
VGKTTTARILAKALNCVKGPTTEPCNECAACVDITSGNSLDVLEIDAASNRGIDQIRELREMVRYAPAGGRHKVVILDEAHQLTDEASNALLKTLEEPPDKVVFIMATTQPEDLADTIKSRAQLFQFRALSFAEVSEALDRISKSEKIKIEPGAVAVLARAAEGSLRDSLSLLEQAISYGDGKITDAQVRELLGVVAEETLDEMFAAVAEKSAEQALGLVHRLLADGQNLQHFCRECIRHFRNLLVAQVCGAESELIAAPKDERARLAKQAAQFSEEELTRFFQILLQTDEDLRRKPDARLHLELGLLKMVNASRLAPLEEVLARLREDGGGERGPTGGAGTSGGGAGTSASRGTGSAVPSGTRIAAPEAATPAASSTQSSVAAAVAVAARSSTASRGDATSVMALPASIEHVSRATDETASDNGRKSHAAPSVQGVNRAAPDEPRDAGSESPKEAENEESGHATPEESVELRGITAEQMAALRTALDKQRFLWSMCEHANRWEMENGEVRLTFAPEDRGVSDMLQARDPMEKLRTILSQVLAIPVRVCVKIGSMRSTTSQTDARARFEKDPKVRAMIERFGGRISSVKRRGEG